MKDLIDVHKIFAKYFKGCETLAYALSDKLSEGNICLDISEYQNALPRLLEEQKAKEPYKEEDALFWAADDFANQCEEGEFVTHSDKELKPFVIQKGYAYLHRYFTYETQIISRIRKLGVNLHIITGGPGTGKTYSVSTKLAELFAKDPTLRVALAAPTGKAAARMNESLRNFVKDHENSLNTEVKTKLAGLKAQTIHLLLGPVSDSVFFRHDEKNRLPYNVVIIDECSMIDGAMMAKLLNAVDDTTTLYLIGDKDQLASVEAGSVFGDLSRAVKSELLKDKVITLMESHRFKKDKGIGRFSTEIIEGKTPDVNSYSKDDQVTIEILNSDNTKTNLFKEKVLKSGLFKQYALEYEDYINKDDIKEALISLNKIRFLCVTRENDYSVSETNKAIEKLLKEKVADKEKFNPKEGFYHNQPIIITQNDYKLGLLNGDVGLIRRESDTLFAWFEGPDGEIIKKIAGYVNHYDTVFAMTIHKSQGSEFDHVVVILPEKQADKLLTRELLYTAITRAKTKVLLQTTVEALDKCATRSVSRASGLETQIETIKK